MILLYSLIMANYTSDEVLDPKGAVKLLNQLIIDEFDLKLPRHSYTQSYFTEKLGMSNEEATQRAEFSKKRFQTDQYSSLQYAKKWMILLAPF